MIDAIQARENRDKAGDVSDWLLKGYLELFDRKIDEFSKRGGSYFIYCFTEPEEWDAPIKTNSPSDVKFFLGDWDKVDLFMESLQDTLRKLGFETSMYKEDKEVTKGRFFNKQTYKFKEFTFLVKW